MPRFCVNTIPQQSGEHEVHNLDAGCDHLPETKHQLYLGLHTNCHGAVTEAKKHYSNVDGCYYCSRECHKR